MQKWDELEEIEALGEEEAWEPEGTGSQVRGELSTVPLLQALLCVLMLAGLLYLKQSGSPHFEKIRERYREEAAMEWKFPEPTVAPSATPVPAPSTAPAGLPGVEVQGL